jgi:S1-C subfamily serine protease
MVGAPLVDEEGRLAGLLYDAAGRAVGADLVDASLRRLAGGQREGDPFTELGLTVQYAFSATTDDSTVSFMPRVTAVRPASLAAQALLRAGDDILRIADTPVAWEVNVAQQLSANRPLEMQVRRGQETLTVTVPVALESR